MADAKDSQQVQDLITLERAAQFLREYRLIQIAWEVDAVRERVAKLPYPDGVGAPSAEAQPASNEAVRDFIRDVAQCGNFTAQLRARALALNDALGVVADAKGLTNQGNGGANA
jgi:hypothetical protein